jgi:hypothetical protein
MGKLHRERRAEVKRKLRAIGFEPNHPYVMSEASYHYSKAFRRENYLAWQTNQREGKRS